MNTSVCFVFLLAVGLSSQVLEYEIEFEKMVNSVPNNPTLLECPENCDELKESQPACQCVDFSCKDTSAYNCIENGLKKLDITCFPKLVPKQTDTCKILKRLRNQNIRESMPWQKPVSPSVFLKYIRTIFESSTAQAMG